MASLVRCGAVLGALLVARTASADPYQVGGFFGPRFFSSDNSLGATDTFRTSLQSSMTLGGRLGRPLYPWLVPEVELPLSFATTRAFDTSVFWVEPRVQARLVWPHGKLRPFVVLGAGLPMDTSSHRGIFANDVSWEGYGGMGATFSPGHGLSFRADLRVGLTSGYVAPVAVEVEGGLGLYFDLGDRHPSSSVEGSRKSAVGDRDGDGIPDDQDQCPDRAEDFDNFQDKDGCPDIDNDGDHVLDIADTCPNVPETYNGFEDDDGCPDTVPGDLQNVLGTVEGLVYAEGATTVADGAKSALARIAAALAKFPGVRVVVTGYTDDREAKLDAVDGEDADAAKARLADALVELSKQRAAAVADALTTLGVSATRIITDGKGDADPTSDNDTPRHRAHNRRVEVMLYVPEEEGRR